jgi:hypothetical protein
MICQREDKVIAKGKGEMTTYWLMESSAVSDLSCLDTTYNESTNLRNRELPIAPAMKARLVELAKKTRLIMWNVELLSDLLSKKVGYNTISKDKFDSPEAIDRLFLDLCNISTVREVREVVSFAKVYDDNRNLSRKAITLNKEVKTQLQLFIQQIASMYNDNPCEFQ